MMIDGGVDDREDAWWWLWLLLFVVVLVLVAVLLLLFEYCRDEECGSVHMFMPGRKSRVLSSVFCVWGGSAAS